LSKIPYATQWIEDDDLVAVAAALKSTNLTQGPLVTQFENKVAEYCGSKYAVAVNSGTSALHIASLAAGISPGDEVITSPITFVASANCALYCGAKPVFADVQDNTINLNPQEIRKKITLKTKAIIPVHFAGNPCEMEEISQIATENNLFVIEDAAHALGADYKGSKIGSCQYSDMTTLSFHAVKHITTGEGGAILTNNDELYEKLKLYRSHGITRDERYLKKSDGTWYYEMHNLGFNYRITDLQSALGISQLKKQDQFLSRRLEIAEVYNQAFCNLKGIKLLEQTTGAQAAWHLYVIQVADRKRIFNHLREKDIIVNVHYIPVYRQPYYQKLGYDGSACPVAEDYYERAISIPMFPKMTDEEVEYVVSLIKEITNGE